MKQSSQPPDTEHAFGHGKIENISGAVEDVSPGILAILVALFILKAAFDLTIKSVKDLLDIKLPGEEEDEIKKAISSLARRQSIIVKSAMGSKPCL